MYVGVSTSEAGKFFTIFAAKEDMEISLDAQVGMKLADLRKKYPSLDRRIAEMIKEHVAQIRASETGLDTSKGLQEPTVRMKSPSSKSYGRILHVGKNYVLLEYVPTRRRYVIPERRITGVALDKSGLDLYVGQNRTRD